METSIKSLLKKLLDFLSIKADKITVVEPEKNIFRVNLESADSSLLIGYHGENIQALQHILKILVRKAENNLEEFSLFLDIDNYRERQEQSVLQLAERKADTARQTSTPQLLPPMSSYFRRLIHLHLAEAKFKDIETESIGEGERRQVVIKVRRSE